MEKAVLLNGADHQAVVGASQLAAELELAQGLPGSPLSSAGIGGPIGIGLAPIGSIGIAPEPWRGRQHAGPRLILLSLILLFLIRLGLALPRLILLVLRLSCRRTGAGGLRRPASILATG
jgi:hypothetical protein